MYVHIVDFLLSSKDTMGVGERKSVFVCVCVCERARARERVRERESPMKKHYIGGKLQSVSRKLSALFS